MGKEDKQEEDTLKKVKKKVVKGAAGAGLSVSVLLAGLFGSPEELTKKNEQAIRNQQPAPVIMTVDLDEAEDTDEDGETEDNTEEEAGGIFAKIKKKILEIPAPIRAIVGVPLWAVGWVIIHVLSIAWEAVLAPVLGIVLKWVLAGLALLGVFAGAMKLAFPHLPLRKILRPKNILFILLGTVILGIVDKVVPMFWNEYTGYRFLIMLGGGLVVLCAVGIPFIIRQLKEQREEEKKLTEKEEKYIVYKDTLENTLLAVKEAVKKPEQREQKTTSGDS